MNCIVRSHPENLLIKQIDKNSTDVARNHYSNCTILAKLFLIDDKRERIKSPNGPGNIKMTDIYQILDDGRIMELRLGRQSERDHAIWARSLTANEKRTYLKLKGMGYSDLNIYNQLNQFVVGEAGAER